jgi:Bacterial archaeo-eukaryotic release factor family 3
LLLITESNFTEITVPDMPADFDTAMQNRAGAGAEVRMRQDEDVKVRLQQYVGDIETSMRPVLRTSGLPLLLAGVELLVSYYRHADTYTHTIGEAIVGNQDNRPTKAIADDARAILRRWYDELVTSWLGRVDDLQGEGLGTTDLAQIARAAEDGRIEALVVDVETHIPGRIVNGVIVEAQVGAGPASYDVLDELAGRTFRQGGRVLGVSSGRILRGAKAAAVFRYVV